MCVRERAVRATTDPAEVTATSMYCANVLASRGSLGLAVITNTTIERAIRRLSRQITAQQQRRV